MTIKTGAHSVFLFLLTVRLLALPWQVIVKPTLPEFQANSAVSLDDDTLHSLIDYGIGLVDAGHYDEALEGCRKLTLCYPESPVGYFYTAALYQVIMRNYRVKTNEQQFERFINLAIETGERAVKKDKEDSISYLYLGGAYGYRALHKIRKHKWFSAFRDGSKSISRLEKAIEAEPTLYDTYYGLGVYHYWRSAKSRTFWFLPFIGDERQKGIDELWQSIRKGKHSEIEGKYALMAICYNEANYGKAWEVNQQLYKLFPNNPSCLYMRGRILEQQGKWKEAEEAFRKLLNHLIASEYKSIGYQIECHYRIALYLSKQKQFQQASKECKLALQLGKLCNPDEELEGPLESAKEILHDAQKLRQQLLKVSIFKKGE